MQAESIINDGCPSAGGHVCIKTAYRIFFSIHRFDILNIYVYIFKFGGSCRLPQDGGGRGALQHAPYRVSALVVGINHIRYYRI